MQRSKVLGAASLAAVAAGVLAVAGAPGSSHREAPLTALDPTADDTDVYAYTADDAKDKLTIVGNWIPFEDPAGGPNFYTFDPRATYYLNIDNTGDGKYDVRYRYKFKTKVVNPESFLYAAPGVKSFDDPALNVKQRYNLDKLYYKNGRLYKSKRVVSGVPVAPSYVGQKTFPDYNSVAAEAIRALPGGSKTFAGQRDDPFFVDLGATFDGITIRKGTGNVGGGKDDVAGYGVNSIVLQVPESEVTKDRKSVSAADADNAVVGVWASTDRPRIQVNGVSASKATKGGKKKRSSKSTSGSSVQVSRLGNPLVNEVVIPLGLKDKFNATQPSDDLKNFGKYVLSPELARLLNLLYPGLNVKENDRTDIVTALLTGVPGLNQITKDPLPTDTLKINMGIDPNPSPNRFGVIGGDTAGFPNGRRLADDVVDIEERVIGGFLIGNKLPLGDGVDKNDKPFLTQFPYLAAPDAGPDSSLKRFEPDHGPTPGDLMPPAP